MKKKVAIHTLGCKVNQYDSEAVVALFRDHNYEIVDFDMQGADVYVINTCTVTNISDRKSRQMIRRAHRHNPSAKIVVFGCYAQTDPEQVTKIDGVNLVIGTDNRHRIVELVEQLEQEAMVSLVDEIANVNEFEEFAVTAFEGRTRASLKIQDGCNQFCSYCKVPYARGRSRSKEPANIVTQAASIAQQGYKEIVLTGVHLGGYGKDLQPLSSLSHIVADLSLVPELKRIRISSVDPNEIDDHLLEQLAENAKVCRHLHIPLQSGSDTILASMRRRYRTSDFRHIVEKVRSLVPEIAITTDVIVGFPGETNELFAETYQFLSEMQLMKLHVFPYSPRSGTPASKFSGQVSSEDKDLRSQRLIALSDQGIKDFHKHYVGQTVSVLVETQTDTLFGLTDNYLHVIINEPVEKDLVGEIVQVKILAVNDHGLEGILV